MTNPKDQTTLFVTNHYNHCNESWIVEGADSFHNDECPVCHGEIQPVFSNTLDEEDKLVFHAEECDPINMGYALAMEQDSEEMELEVLRTIIEVAAVHLSGNKQAQKEIASSIIGVLSNSDSSSLSPEMAVLQMVSDV